MKMQVSILGLTAFIGMVFVLAQLDSAQAECDLADSTCPCPKIYKPICASNGETYNNPCIFECFKKECPEEARNVEKVSDGRCDGESEEFEDL